MVCRKQPNQLRALYLDHHAVGRIGSGYRVGDLLLGYHNWLLWLLQRTGFEPDLVGTAPDQLTEKEREREKKKRK